MPLFHMNEVSGQMTAIVMKFLKGEKLSERGLNDLRWYVHQWVRDMPSKPDDYDRILKMSREELKGYIDVLLDFGIDPF